jgi:hypothetical protein
VDNPHLENMTTSKSCINHPEKIPLVLLRSDYLEICGNHCAAKLLAIFEFWTNKLSFVADRLGKVAREWIYKSLACLQSELMGEHGIHAIRKGISVLEGLGFITKRHNPHIKYDRTFQYRLEVGNVQKALDLLICQGEQIEDEIVENPSDDLELSNTHISTNNTKEHNIVPPKKKTKTREKIFAKKEEEDSPAKAIAPDRTNVIKQIATYFHVGYQAAENTFYQWQAEWESRPSSREWLQEKLALLKLDPSVLT